MGQLDGPAWGYGDHPEFQGNSVACLNYSPGTETRRHQSHAYVKKEPLSLRWRKTKSKLAERNGSIGKASRSPCE
ncbi:hypothetical protein KM043_004561 [Ampulex compressa]|nr:hypothetical protein KM043_004561 [Ampulex compressa]